MADPGIKPELELPVATCRDCGERFRQSRSNRVFCSHRCNRNFWGRCQKRGGVLYPKLVLWRKSRGKSEAATLSDICAILDDQIAEDKAAGRVLVCEVYTEEQLADPYNPARERRLGKR